MRMVTVAMLLAPLVFTGCGGSVSQDPVTCELPPGAHETMLVACGAALLQYTDWQAWHAGCEVCDDECVDDGQRSTCVCNGLRSVLDTGTATIELGDLSECAPDYDPSTGIPYR